MVDAAPSTGGGGGSSAPDDDSTGGTVSPGDETEDAASDYERPDSGDSTAPPDDSTGGTVSPGDETEDAAEEFDDANNGGRPDAGDTRPRSTRVTPGTTDPTVETDVEAGGGFIDRVSTGASTFADRVREGAGDVREGAGDVVDRVVRDTQRANQQGAAGRAQNRAGLFDGTGPNQIDRDITDRLTTGGLLSEQRDSSEGLLPGEIGAVDSDDVPVPADYEGVDISEARLREEAEDTREARNERFESNPDLTIAGSDLPDRVITGAAQAASEITNPAGLATSAETALEVGTSAPGTIADEGAGDVAATAGAVGVTAGAATVDSAQESPAEFAGGAAFNLIGGAGAGRQLGNIGRATRDRVRTAGGTEIDPSDLASDDVIRNVETDGAEGTRFPGADDPDLYQSDPAEAVRQQADANTPQQIEDTFSDAGVADGTTLTKALDVEPEGPARGRADTGFSSAPGETADDFDYETPGSFAGPELSPNFLGVGDTGGSGLSLRPGVPDTGNNPTGVLVRTDVENPDADTLDEFNREMIDRSGDTTAVTKPADEVNTGEIEAVVPPGAQFRSVGSGGARGTLQRFGIGSDFYTEIGGRRVPLRTVAPDRDRGDAGDSDILDGGDGPDRNTGGGGQTLDDLSERVETPTDRPVPGFGVGGSGSGPTSSPSGSGGGESPFGDVSSGFDSGSGSGGGSPPGSAGPPGSGSNGPSGGGSGGSSGGGFGGGSGSPAGGSPPPSATSQPALPTGFDGSTTRRNRRRSDEAGSDNEDPFSYLVESESDEFGSGILSGDEAAEQFFGR